MKGWAVKDFPTLAVMGVYTGFILGKGRDGFEGIHEVMDHFYPGIMTIGVAAMSKNAAKAVAAQLPEVATVKGDPSRWEAFAASALSTLGPTLKLSGPLKTSDGEIGEAFKEFASGMRHPDETTRGRR